MRGRRSPHGLRDKKGRIPSRVNKNPNIFRLCDGGINAANDRAHHVELNEGSSERGRRQNGLPQKRQGVRVLPSCIEPLVGGEGASGMAGGRGDAESPASHVAL